MRGGSDTVWVNNRGWPENHNQASQMKLFNEMLVATIMKPMASKYASYDIIIIMMRKKGS
jgi:hypothetical protein